MKCFRLRTFMAKPFTKLSDILAFAAGSPGKSTRAAISLDKSFNSEHSSSTVAMIAQAVGIE